MRLPVICDTLGPLCEGDSLIQSIIRALQRADSAIGGLLERCDEVVDRAYGMGEALMFLLSSRLEENAATDI